MKCASSKIISIIFLILSAFTSCNPFAKSWEMIYKEQQELFNNNRQTFEQAAEALNISPVSDTTLFIKDSYLLLPDTLVRKLRDLGISTVTIYKHNCKTKDLRFTPDSLWDYDRFSVMEIKYNKCDDRSRKGYHWTLKGSEHKHSFGQGDGWFIYSDSDKDPF